MADSIKDALKTAKVNLLARVREREKIDKEIAKWQRVVESLSAVAEEVSEDLPADLEVAGGLAGSVPFVIPPQKIKFTDAVRSIVQDAQTMITAPEVRDRLVGMGFDFSKYAQELVPVHNTLKRLHEQGEVEPIKKDGQTIGYKWISPVVRALEKERSNWLSNTEAILGQLGEISASDKIAPRTRPPRGIVSRVAQKLMEEHQEQQKKLDEAAKQAIEEMQQDSLKNFFRIDKEKK